MRSLSNNAPQRAWKTKADALRFAFGFKRQEKIPPIVVLLHRDRLAELENILTGSKAWFGGRWRGLRWDSTAGRIAFIVTDQGASDVGDCLLHLAVAPPRLVLYTGTCGGIHPRIKVGQKCLVVEGWMSDSFTLWAQNPLKAVDRAEPVASLLMDCLDDLISDLQGAKNIQAVLARVFTTASQASESKIVLKKIHELGADVLDMETGIFLAVSRLLKLKAAALLWCTDLPLQKSSFYDQTNPEHERTKEHVWRVWPRAIADAACSLAGKYVQM